MTSRKKPIVATDRVRLYLTLVPYLLERGEVSLAEAAAEFGVSTTELRSMIETLTVIGLPGDRGYWQQPHELFDINWDLLDSEGVIEITNEVGLRRVPRFTAREAAALLSGLQYIASLPVVAESGLVSDLQQKLARASVKTRADVVVAPERIDEVRAIVAAALDRRVAVSFSYRAPDATPTTRTVDPVSVLITGGQWYLEGWCHLRRAMRTFLLDRVQDAALTATPISHGAAPDTAATEFADTEVAVTLAMPASLTHVEADVLGATAAQNSAAPSTVTLHLADPRSVKRLATRGGGATEVLSPPVARSATRDWAAAGLALYEQPAAAVGE